MSEKKFIKAVVRTAKPSGTLAAFVVKHPGFISG